MILRQKYLFSAAIFATFAILFGFGDDNDDTQPKKTTPSEMFKKYPSLSTPLQCARQCRKGESSKTCYYHFTLENYMTLGNACQLCKPNDTNQFTYGCQCIEVDGIERSILSANRMIPGPSIQVCEGDKVVVDVENQIEGEEVTIHWHGLRQMGTQYYDGVPFVTQCPIHQGNNFRYQWYAANAGTHFWHAHTGLQKLNGLQGSLIVRHSPEKDPNSELYDYDLTSHVMMLNDWMHELAAEKFPGRLRNNIAQDPESLLINGKGQYIDPETGNMTNTPLEMFNVTSGKRYRFRMINAFATVCPAQLSIEGHKLLIIATDGIPVEPIQVDTIISFSGERYDFVINATQSSRAYWIQLRGLGECGIAEVQQLAILMYANATEMPTTQRPSYLNGLPQGIVLNPLDGQCGASRSDAVCVNQLKNAGEIDKELLKPNADVKIFLPFRFFNYTTEQIFRPQTYNRFLVSASGRHIVSLIDGISSINPPAPLISQYNDIDPRLFCNGKNKPSNCSENCMCIHKIDIPLNKIVEIILVDEVQRPNLSHPFHLHGYTFRVIGIGKSQDREVNKINVAQVVDLDKRGLLKRQMPNAPGKDTLQVPNNGYIVIRFQADNPGFWFFHCHFLYHIVIGMNLILHVGAKKDLPSVPPRFPTCGDYTPNIYI